MMTPQYSTVLFTQVYDNVDTFLEDYNNIGIPAKVQESNVKTLYYLLYARFANSPIANRDINQFKYKLFSIIFEYGPTWEKELDIQDRLNSLTEEELSIGNRIVYNHAYNPGDEPSTSSLNELSYIDRQSTQNTKRSKVDGYAVLLSLLDDKITERFVKRFTKLFKQFVLPEDPVLYYDDYEEN